MIPAWGGGEYLTPVGSYIIRNSSWVWQSKFVIPHLENSKPAKLRQRELHSKEELKNNRKLNQKIIQNDNKEHRKVA